MRSQSISRKLVSANVITFHKTLFVYGYEQTKNDLQFKCYSYNYKLQLADSINHSLGKHSPADFVDISVDTLHDYLNFYFQLANQKNVVSLLRLNDTLAEIATTRNYDANHVNSLTTFDNEKYIYKNNLYIIKKTKDSSNNQFYIIKHQLKNINQPFEYNLKWQFSFERKFINRASIIYADSTSLLTYVNIIDGIKKGQWILKINAKTGELIKGTKLNPKTDTRHYLLSNINTDTKLKNTTIIGSIYDENMIDFKNNHSNFSLLAKNQTLFLITIDSLGDVTSRIEKKFPTPIQLNQGKNIQSYHLKIREFTKNTDGSFNIWSDLYEQTKPNIFTYYSSWQFNLVPNDVDYEMNRSNFSISSKVIPNFISLEKGDYYGKYIIDPISNYDKFKYKKTQNEVVIKTGLDDLNNTFYILKKTEILSAKKSYNYIFMGKKGLENNVILKSEQGQNSNLFFTDKKSYISFITNIGNTEFELKVNNL